jgi:hypothetical protein
MKGSASVTITLDRTTVAMLRTKKKGLETWDALMQRLGGWRRYGLECTICGAFLEIGNMDKTPNMVAKENGWQKVYSNVVHVDGEEIARQVELGYICPSCGDRT